MTSFTLELNTCMNFDYDGTIFVHKRLEQFDKYYGAEPDGGTEAGVL